MLNGLAYAEYADASSSARLESAFSLAVEHVAFTGTGSVSVTSFADVTEASLGPRTQAEFQVTIPISMTAKEVKISLQKDLESPSRRSGLTFFIMFSGEMKASNLTVPGNFSIGAYGSTDLVEPVVAATGESYTCPYPLNCIPESNSSVCAAGATGPACAWCISKWFLSHESEGWECVSCEGKTGSIPILGIIIAVLASLACVVFAVRLYLGPNWHIFCGGSRSSKAAHLTLILTLPDDFHGLETDLDPR